MFIGAEVDVTQVGIRYENGRRPADRYPLEFNDALHSLIVGGNSETAKTGLTKPLRSTPKRRKK